MIGPSFEELLNLAEERKLNAKAPGTWVNLNSAKKKYLRFCSEYSLHHKVSPTILIAYIEFLYFQGNSPGSIRNYISNLSTILRIEGTPSSAFNSMPVTLALEAILKDKSRVSPPRPSIPLNIFISAVQMMENDLY